MTKTVFITGITGQDGAYLARFLLEKGITVYGGYRRTSSPNFWRLDELGIKEDVNLIEIDLQDSGNLIRALEKTQCSEIYNLAAQSFVAVSFEQPILTGETTGLGVTRLYEAVRIVNPEIKIYQASTSEMYGMVKEIPQTESTPFHPMSPYGAAKLYGHWINDNYRRSYNIFGCSGILFNHESPLRGIEFVTRKITDAAARIKKGTQNYLEVGNMDAKRDWGFAGDYVKGMYLMLQQQKPDDYILATGKSHTVREFIEAAFKAVDISIIWQGSGIDEKGTDRSTGKTLVQINPRFFRPAEVDLLQGDPSKARKLLGWEPEVQFQQLVEMMVHHDLKRVS